MQGVGMFNMFLNEMLVIVVNCNIQTFIGYNSSFVKGIFFRMAKGYKFIILLKIWKFKSCNPANGFKSCLPRPFQSFSKGSEFSFCRNFVESSNSHVNRMNFSTSKKADNFISGLFELKSS